MGKLVDKESRVDRVVREGLRAPLIDVAVPFFDEEPVVPTALGGMYERPATPELVAPELEEELAVLDTMLAAGISIQTPLSQQIDGPAPYWPSGMTPSNSAYSNGWGSTCMASRLSAGSGEGPFGTAQDSRTPSISSRRSQWSELA